MHEYLFAYGTLQLEHAPQEILPLLAGLDYIGDASVRGMLYDLGDYPGAVLDPSSDFKVFGKVFEILDTASTLPELDRYEEFDPQAPSDSLFVRVLQPVELESGQVLQCWIYNFNRDPGAAPVFRPGRFSK